MAFLLATLTLPSEEGDADRLGSLPRGLLMGTVLCPPELGRIVKYACVCLPGNHGLIKEA